VRGLLTIKQITVLENPPYSPDLGPHDFFSVPEDKKILKECILMKMMTGVIRRQL
jgi:hypothetical protein